MHVSNDLREEFELYIVEGPYFNNNEAVFHQAKQLQLLADLEGCTDTLPSDQCERLEIPVGSSYADAVKYIRGFMRGLKAPKVEAACLIIGALNDLITKLEQAEPINYNLLSAVSAQAKKITDQLEPK
jgi:hypothetical protein